jgi:hypothetical protein
MQSVTSNAVAEAIENIPLPSEVRYKSAPSYDFNDFIPDTRQRCVFYNGSLSRNYTNAPYTFTSYSESAGVFLLEARRFGRVIIQTFYTCYYSNAWYVQEWQRKKVDSSWFSWNRIEQYI